MNIWYYFASKMADALNDAVTYYGEETDTFLSYAEREHMTDEEIKDEMSWLMNSKLSMFNMDCIYMDGDTVRYDRNYITMPYEEFKEIVFKYLKHERGLL